MTVPAAAWSYQVPTVHDADRIAALNSGKLTEFRGHDDLVAVALMARRPR